MRIFRRGGKSADSGAGEIDTYVGSASRVEGDLVVEGTVRVDGVVAGDIRGDDLVVIIGKSGRVTGNITARQVFAGGRVEGDINASRGIEVFSSALLEGTFRYATITIEEGAQVEGTFHKTVAREDASVPEEGNGDLPGAETVPGGQKPG